jgi:ABC-type protease/lipase transport system fused ATPase/permease subunit
MNEVIVSVKYGYSTYTASLGKTRASCTAGERQAVERLAEKLYGKDAEVVLKRLRDLYPGKAEWSIAENEAT